MIIRHAVDRDASTRRPTEMQILHAAGRVDREPELAEADLDRVAGGIIVVCKRHPPAL